MTKGTKSEVQWNDGIIGHESIIRYLSQAIASERVAHAFLFVGPERVGKATVARHFGASLLRGGEGRPSRVAALSAHPDFTYVERERDAKTDKLHADITISQVRTMVVRLSLGAMMNGWKICVLDGAHLLNKESGNALLKTLEEPHAKTVLILIATSAEQVLPTVRSRCQVVRFGRVPTAALAEALVRRGTPRESADLYARLSGGRPGAAVSFAEDPSSLEDMFALRDEILAMPGQRVAARFASIERVLPPKMPFQDSVQRAIAWTDMAAELLRDALLIRLGAPERIVHVDARARLESWVANDAFDPAASLAVIESSRHLLDANVSPRATLDRVAVAL